MRRWVGWARSNRLALAAGAVAFVLVAVLAGTAVAIRAVRSGGTDAAAARHLTAATPGAAAAAVTPEPGAIPPSPTAPPVSPAPSAVAPAAPAVPAHLGTLPPGAALPSGSQCAAWVRASPLPESRGANRGFNQATGQHVPGSFFPTSDDARASLVLAPRIDGQFTGTTHEILRWAACKWGIDEDIVAAQAALESWWRQDAQGDWGPDATACALGHGLGADGRPGQCPQSFGILQNRYPYEQATWPGIQASTAMNADTAYAVWRACYEGDELWLDQVDRGAQYRAGDVWGCIGRWFAGRWHTDAANQYTGRVQAYVAQRVWEQPGFPQA